MVGSLRARYTAASCSPEPHRDDREHIGGRRPSSHRLPELPPRFRHVSARNRQPGGCGVEQEGRGVVIEPLGLDDAARDTHVFIGTIRVAAVKCQQRELGLREDEDGAAAHLGARCRRLVEQVAGLIDVAEQEVGFAEQTQDGGPPRTPWRLLGQCQCRIGQHRLGAVLAHRRSQRRLGGLERGVTIPRWQVERGGVDHRGPPLRPDGVAREHARQAGVQRQRRPGRDRLVAQGGEPALQRRQPSGVVERLRQLGRQLRRPVSLRGAQQVLDCHRRRPVGLVPVRRPQMQDVDHVGFAATKFGEQELLEQGLIAIPLPLAVQRNHEQTRCLQPAQLLRRVRRSDDRIAQRTAEVIEHRRAP